MLAYREADRTGSHHNGLLVVERLSLGLLFSIQKESRKERRFFQ